MLPLSIVYLLLPLQCAIFIRREQSVKMQISEKEAARNHNVETEFLRDRLFMPRRGPPALNWHESGSASSSRDR